MSCLLDSNGSKNPLLLLVMKLDDLGKLSATQINKIRTQINNFNAQVHSCQFDCHACSGAEQQKRVDINCSFVLDVLSKMEVLASNDEGGEDPCKAEVA